MGWIHFSDPRNSNLIAIIVDDGGVCPRFFVVVVPDPLSEAPQLYSSSVPWTDLEIRDIASQWGIGEKESSDTVFFVWFGLKAETDPELSMLCYPQRVRS